jgi:hypothetical protein
MESSTYKIRKKKGDASSPNALSRADHEVQETDPRPAIYSKLTKKIQQKTKHVDQEQSKSSMSKVVGSSSPSVLSEAPQSKEELDHRTALYSELTKRVQHPGTEVKTSNQNKELRRGDPGYVKQLFNDLSKKITERSDKVK